MDAHELTRTVVEVMADVLVHQRGRWGALLGHQRQYEGWWKAEMALALESWTWRADQQATPMYVVAEQRPADYGVVGAPGVADLLVAKVNRHPENHDFNVKPRAWIVVRERSTWWGEAGVGGLEADLASWRDVKTDGDVIIICQITIHDGTVTEQLPAAWRDALAETAEHTPPLIQRCVGYEIAGNERIRWARFDAFAPLASSE